MSVVDFADGARFTVRVRSSLASNRRVRWHNTYEVRSTSAGGYGEIVNLATALGGLHTSCCYNYVYIDEATVSSWEPDSHPYNPLAFATIALNDLGAVPLGVKLPVSLRQTLFLKRVVVGGLQGKLFLRGALSNEDIEYADGEWQLADPAGLQADVNTAVGTSGVDAYLMGVDGVQFSLCLLGASGATRFQEEFAVAGTSDIKLNHKYFDRS